MHKLSVVLFSLISLHTMAQTEEAPHSHRMGRALKFPNVPGYHVMKCDLHMHTVFSDGAVWPDIRVAEALMDGLDAISLTEHLEYQPHKADIPHPDRNRSYELALKEAKDHHLLIIRGSEITRKMPPGHNNAVFIEDANKMLISDSVEVFREAKRQNAFTFWNHPMWVSQRPDGMATLTPMHKMLIKEKLLDGIEVVNDGSYSDEALQIALDNNLTIMGTSDVHKLVDWTFGVPKGGHRPITLVFSKDTTAAGIKEGLMNRRTVAFFKDLLIGRDEYLVPLVKESLKITSAKYRAKTTVLDIEIENLTSSAFTLKNKSKYTFDSHSDLVTIPAGGKVTIEVKTVNKINSVELSFEVLNAINAPNSHPTVSWSTQTKL
ncbi:Sb-PDE family phosphodiesterase [Paraflavitalea pollutisoli]|uniref:Sb-PDE family phosphodiesterase n=1 Tax=Paraflavitalea pollutisoli TaxID=3034143 RepID=UPI0023ECD107|nr:Sb-PDE family phosphodiesterase [Paraflavitalea sp. H1-2-19X]